jgi:ribosomal protein S18 acetylase RimI-like enzyme
MVSDITSLDRVAAISRIERHSAQAWPAPYVTQHYGWELRRSPQLASRRVNSLNAVSPEPGRFAEALAEAQSICDAAGTACHVRLVSVAADEAKQHLRASGLSGAAETTVKTIALDQDFPVDPRVSVDQRLSDEWLDTYLQADQHDEAERAALKAALATVNGQQGFAIAHIDGLPQAVGRGVVQDGYLGIYQIATLPHARRKGLGSAIVTALMKWGKQHAAQTAYLQVVSTNLPARALYRRLGFAPFYSYDYWTMP